MLRFVRLAPVALLLLLVGCSDSTGPISVTLNRARWEKQNLHNYLYTGRMSCFCPQSGQDVYVTVPADTVSYVALAGSGALLPKEGWYTIPGLFDFVVELHHHDGKVRVEYDPQLGYPTRISLTCDDTMLDCGLTMQARDLTPIPHLE